MSASETHPPRIVISVRSEYLPVYSRPEDNHYVFAYHINISNHGDSAAQLINRYWLITDGNGHQQEVRGEGVVGEQPLLAPGEDFAYTSGCVLETPVGTMQGSYQMQASDGERFQADIPPFMLAMPGSLH